MAQLTLPGLSAAPALPDGVRYAENVLSAGEERAAIDVVASLNLAPFAFHGFLGNRRTVSFGWHYDFQAARIEQAAPIPDALLPYRKIAADFAGVAPDALEHLLVIEYAPGAGIGWHRDKAQFGIVTALSLAAPCRMRFRRKAGERWDRLSVDLAPRSAYVLSGPGRSEWEHSIPAVDRLRYSLTFRTLKDKGAPGARR